LAVNTILLKLKDDSEKDHPVGDDVRKATSALNVSMV